MTANASARTYPPPIHTFLPCGCQVPPAASTFVTAQNYSYAQAQAQCTHANMQLCMRDEICSNGVPKDMFKTTTYQWMPVLDGDNDWVEVNINDTDRLCRLHSSLGSLPPWGNNSEYKVWKAKNVGCCPVPPAASTFVTAQNYSYAQAQAQCTHANMQLCMRDEICSNGVPKDMFKTTTYQWMPVLDGDNDWVEVNINDTDRLCRLHSSLGSLPPWGNNSEYKVWKAKNVGCCPGEFAEHLEEMFL
eukprot:gene347-1726_t